MPDHWITDTSQQSINMSNYLITGTSRGLGLCLVKELLKRPATSVGLIFTTTRSAPTPALQRTIDESAGRVVNVIVNPVDMESVKAALPAVEKHLNGAGLDVLINNVGVLPFSNGIKEISFAYQDVFARLPAPAYKVTKAALNMLTLQWGMEYLDKGFTIFGVSPGWLKTELGGEGANLEPEQGAEATMKVIDAARKEEAGKMINIHLEGFGEGHGDFYQGGVVPW
ncbi:short chain oxidoreductase [Apiospora kogelbergensis]|uniref:Short chain oxidoreductase n=1 Tax=Apiospora kogelbergensis TaxID=1337665 RepID=A0AAW0QYU3_9PEZI